MHNGGGCRGRSNGRGLRSPCRSGAPSIRRNISPLGRLWLGAHRRGLRGSNDGRRGGRRWHALLLDGPGRPGRRNALFLGIRRPRAAAEGNAPFIGLARRGNAHVFAGGNAFLLGLARCRDDDAREGHFRSVSSSASRRRPGRPRLGSSAPPGSASAAGLRRGSSRFRGGVLLISCLDGDHRSGRWRNSYDGAAQGCGLRVRKFGHFAGALPLGHACSPHERRRGQDPTSERRAKLVNLHDPLNAFRICPAPLIAAAGQRSPQVRRLARIGTLAHLNSREPA